VSGLGVAATGSLCLYLTPNSRPLAANSQDHGIIKPDVPVIAADFGPISDLVPFPEAKTVYIGRDFYALSGNFAEGTKLQVSKTFSTTCFPLYCGCEKQKYTC
jgi:hypothetical protein